MHAIVFQLDWGMYTNESQPSSGGTRGIERRDMGHWFCKMLPAAITTTMVLSHGTMVMVPRLSSSIRISIMVPNFRCWSYSDRTWSMNHMKQRLRVEQAGRVSTIWLLSVKCGARAGMSHLSVMTVGKAWTSASCISVIDLLIFWVLLHLE